MAKFVVMGVSGCGKSSVGQALAEAVGLTFIDGDDLHPPSNIAKMSAGMPLDDTDRAPWLVAVGRALAQEDGSVAIGCSALKRAYRDIIRGEAGQVQFLHLAAPKSVLAERVAARKGHFMPPALLDSQYATLEHLEADETGTVLDIAQPLARVIKDAVAYVQRVS